VERASLARPTSSGWQHRAWATADRTSASSVESLSSNPATRSETANGTETVFESPDGTFEIQQAARENDDEDQKFFVVSKANPNEKRLLTTQPGLWAGNLWYSSPDSKWLTTAIKEVHEVGRMELFRRIEGLKFDKIRGGPLISNESTWRRLISDRYR
jgi:hypothetical protein